MVGTVILNSTVDTLTLEVTSTTDIRLEVEEAVHGFLHSEEVDGAVELDAVKLPLVN